MHVECVIEIEIVVAIEVSPDEVIDLGLGSGVHVLELVHCLELDNIETIWENTIGLALEQMSALVGHDVENGRENVGAVGGRALNAVAVVDAALAGLMVDVEVLEVVVKVDRAGAEVAAEESGMGGEDSAQALERSGIVHRAPLHEEREGGEAVGEGTGGKDGLEEVGVGRALRGG